MTTTIKICTACDCSQRFSDETVKKAESMLKIKVGESTPDGRFRLEKTGCLSHCERGPNVYFGTELEGHVENGMLPHRFEKKLNSLLKP